MKIRIENVRIAFPTLFRPVTVQGEGKPSFSAQFIIVPGSENEKKIETAMKSAAKERWKNDAPQVYADLIKKNRTCFLKANKTNASGETIAGFEGNYALSARSPSKPLVLDRSKNEIGEAAGVIYGGCYVDASVEMWAQEHKSYGRRINCALKGVQFRADGDAFTGGAPASADDFDNLEDTGVGDLMGEDEF